MKVGLITYHSAYNFGSVLQAYATQKIITKLGHRVEIINYRMPSQKNYYSLLIVFLILQKKLIYQKNLKNSKIDMMYMLADQIRYGVLVPVSWHSVIGSVL